MALDFQVLEANPGVAHGLQGYQKWCTNHWTFGGMHVHIARHVRHGAEPGLGAYQRHIGQVPGCCRSFIGRIHRPSASPTHHSWLTRADVIERWSSSSFHIHKHKSQPRQPTQQVAYWALSLWSSDNEAFPRSATTLKTKMSNQAQIKHKHNATAHYCSRSKPLLTASTQNTRTNLRFVTAQVVQTSVRS